MADDAFVFEQAVNVALRETGYPVEIKIVECGAKVFAFGEDGAPAQSGLKTFQTQFLEQAMIVTDRETPFRIVIGEKLRCGTAPLAARFAVGTFCCLAHILSFMKNREQED